MKEPLVYLPAQLLLLFLPVWLLLYVTAICIWLMFDCKLLPKGYLAEF
jgi:hypothetical protein